MSSAEKDDNLTRPRRRSLLRTVTLTLLASTVCFGVLTAALSYRFARSVRDSAIERTVENLALSGELDRCDAKPERWAYPNTEHPRVVAFRDDGRAFLEGFETKRAPAIQGPTAPGIVEPHFDGIAQVLYETGRSGPCHRLALDILRGQPYLASHFGFIGWRLLLDALWLALTGTLVAVPLIRRIRRMAAAARAVVEADFEGQVPVPPDEFKDLALAFNRAADKASQMIATLSAREETLRNQMADLAHDVRTPLSTLKLRLGRLSSERTALDGQLTVMRSEVEYLDGLFANVAALAQLDGESLQVQFTSVDIGALLSAVAARFEVMATDRALQLDVSVPDELLRVQGDSVLLAQAVSNVVHNAIKFGRSAITIWGVKRSHGVEIGVLDDGPGVGGAPLSALMQRHHQGPLADLRPAHSGPRGIGLGLAITARLLERHAGRLALGGGPDGIGTQVTLTLPIGC